MFKSYAICQYFREIFIISRILEVIIVGYTLCIFVEQHAFWKTKLEERVGLSKLLIKERFAEKLRSHSKYINGLLSFFYAGFFRFKRDIEMMIGDKICVGVCFWYFGACWLLISPLALLVSKHTVQGNQENFPVLFTQFSLSYHSDLFDSYRLSSSSRSSRQNRLKTMATCTRIVVR